MSAERPAEPASMSGIIADYLAAVEAGRVDPPESWLARYPEHAAELAEFFAGQADLDGIAAPLRDACAKDSPERPSDTPTAVERHGEVRSPRPVSLDTSRPRLFGDYELLEEIARGGMGVVYRARHLRMNRVVALKTILTGTSATKDDLERFRIEVEAAAQLDHPHIVPIYEVGERDGQHFFTMKLIEGGSLTQHMPRLQQDHRLAASLLSKVARAIHYAHQRGIVHRDLKPGNILLSISDLRFQISDQKDTAVAAKSEISNLKSEIVPYVTDFGLAKRLQSEFDVTKTGQIIGTPNYMAPEQATGRKDVGIGVDIYSLGAILYQVLTGKRPFEAETPMATLLLIQSATPEAPSAVNRNVPRDLETICLKCLEKDPRRRYDSAAELAEDLERWTAGESIRARRPSRLTVAYRWLRRRPALAASVGLLVVCLVLGVEVFRSRSPKPEPVRPEPDSISRQQVEDYANLIAQAQEALNHKDRQKAEQILDQCAPDMRHWEWHFLMRHCKNLKPTAFEEKNAPNPITDLQWGPNHFLATASTFKPITLWNVAAGKKWETKMIASQLTASPDGKRLAIAGNAVNVVNWESERLVPGWRGLIGQAMDACFSADGKRLAVCHKKDNLIAIFDANSGAEITSWKDDTPYNAIAFHPDGTRLAVTGPMKGAVLWEASSGRLLRDWPVTGTGLAFHPQGEQLAIAGLSDNKVHLLAVSGTEGLRSLPGACLSYSRDGRRLASVSQDGTVLYLSEPITGVKILEWPLGGPKSAGWLPVVAFDPSSERLAIGVGIRLLLLNGSVD